MRTIEEYIAGYDPTKNGSIRKEFPSLADSVSHLKKLLRKLTRTKFMNVLNVAHNRVYRRCHVKSSRRP